MQRGGMGREGGYGIVWHFASLLAPPLPLPLSCVKYVQEPMNSRLLETALDLYMVFEAYPQSLLVAMQLNRADLIRRVFVTCQDE